MDGTGEYFAILYGAVLYDVNVPGGLKKLLAPSGLTVGPIQNQVSVMEDTLYPGMMTPTSSCDSVKLDYKEFEWSDKGSTGSF